jgi:hypothetical protein
VSSTYLSIGDTLTFCRVQWAQIDGKRAVKMSKEIPVYEIRLRGHLDARRARQFEGLTMTLLPEGETLLYGPVLDQAALHGILNRIRDMGVPLIYARRVGPPAREGDP